MKHCIRTLLRRSAVWTISAALLITAVPAAGSLPGVRNSTIGEGITTETTAIAARTVYYATHSYCYHVRRNCRTLARSRHVYRTSIGGAKRKGLRACRVCSRGY